MESDHGLEKILGVGLELEFKSMESDWIGTLKKVTPLISAKQWYNRQMHEKCHSTTYKSKK